MLITPTAQPGTCPIQKIPLEVLLRISYLLHTTDLGNLRLTCRSIEQCLYATFVQEFFTRKQFMVTADSLQALIDISNSRMSPHLRYVYIGLDRFPEGVQRPLPDDEKEAKFREHYANNFTLWKTGHHRDMLAEAFRNLTNLEDVVIRDYNSRRRSRDGWDAEWHSYGYTTVFNGTGVSLNQGMTGIWNSGFPYQYCSDVFTTIMYALGSAGTKLKGIEILSRNSNHLRDFAFNILPFMEPSVLPIIQNLEKLHLCIDLAWRNPNIGWTRTTMTSRPAADLCIRKFLSYATNLKDLRINEHRSNSAGLADLLDWMAGDSKAGTPGPKLSMPRLEELSLGSMNVEPPRLLNLIGKFAPSLQRLSLWKVTLIQALPVALPAPSLREIYWSSFLDDLLDIPGLNIRHFKAGMLQQQWIERPIPAHIGFKDHGPTIEYTGPDWKHFIGEVRPLIEIHWPYERHSNDEEDGDDDDDDDDGVLAREEEEILNGEDSTTTDDVS